MPHRRVGPLRCPAARFRPPGTAKVSGNGQYIYKLTFLIELNSNFGPFFQPISIIRISRISHKNKKISERRTPRAGISTHCLFGFLTKNPQPKPLPHLGRYLCVTKKPLTENENPFLFDSKDQKSINFYQNPKKTKNPKPQIQKSRPKQNDFFWDFCHPWSKPLRQSVRPQLFQ